MSMTQYVARDIASRLHQKGAFIAPDGMDSGADKLMAAFAENGLRRETAEAMWEFFEVTERARQVATKEEARMTAMFPAMLIEAMKAPLPRLHLRVLRMAIGWADVSIESGRRVARDYSFSAEQISNLLESLQEKYRLPKNQFNKTAEATAGYKTTNGKL